MELTGKIVAVLDAKSGKSSKTGNPWMMQEYVIEVPGQYPRHCMFSIFGEDKIKQLNIQNGEDLTVQFDIDAREYNGRWYNDIRAYGVVRGQQSTAGAPMAAAAPSAATAPFPPAQEPVSEGSSDDLPF